ncbi:Uncharacterised protein [Klebsiella pneumoniae]|nr:Uncharacterised protein [Klebsiella pneumoniae]
MFNALTACNYAGEPNFRVFPDNNRLQYTQLLDVQYHPFVDRQVDTFIVEKMGFVGNKMQLFRFEHQNVGFAVGAVYKL